MLNSIERPYSDFLPEQRSAQGHWGVLMCLAWSLIRVLKTCPTSATWLKLMTLFSGWRVLWVNAYVKLNNLPIKRKTGIQMDAKGINDTFSRHGHYLQRPIHVEHDLSLRKASSHRDEAPAARRAAQLRLTDQTVDIGQLSEKRPPGRPHWMTMPPLSASVAGMTN
jgi:hypothetical protein